jgi:hypothetical protein
MNYSQKKNSSAWKFRGSTDSSKKLVKNDM